MLLLVANASVFVAVAVQLLSLMLLHVVLKVSVVVRPEVTPSG